MTHSTDDYAWLTGEEAGRVLTALADDPRPLHTLASRLRRDFSHERVALLLEQTELRKRAAAKFSRAARMFFSRVALQQATDEWTAGYKARRFARFSSAADLCCGVGGDLIALAGATRADGVEQDGGIARLAEANLAAYDRPSRARVGDAEPEAVAQCAAWHADPDRRAGGKRSVRLENHSPSGAALDAIRNVCPHTAIKLAPAARVPDHWEASAELEWISRGGECRQQVAWFGDTARAPGARRATSLTREGAPAGQFLGCPDLAAPVARELGEYVLEPDPAVLAARLSGALAERHGLAQVADGVAYLTGDAPPADPLLAAFRVLEVLPLRRAALARALRARGVGRLEIKHRGVELDPARFRHGLKLKGERHATLIATQSGASAVAVLADRVT